MSAHQRRVLRRLELVAAFVAGGIAVTALFIALGWADDGSAPAPTPDRIPATVHPCPPEVVAEPLLVCA